MNTLTKNLVAYQINAINRTTNNTVKINEKDMITNLIHYSLVHTYLLAKSDHLSIDDVCLNNNL